MENFTQFVAMGIGLYVLVSLVLFIKDEIRMEDLEERRLHLSEVEETELEYLRNKRMMIR